MKILAVVVLLLAGCADARDLFRPYDVPPQEIEEVLALPKLPALDAAIVLGCPAQPDGTPSDCQRCRVDAAVAAYRNHEVRALIFSGAAAHSPLVEADVMGDLAVRNGVPADAVFREGRALTTWQNIRYARAIAKAHGLLRLLIVSTAEHLPRARRIARFYGLEDDQTSYRACDRANARAVRFTPCFASSRFSLTGAGSRGGQRSLGSPAPRLPVKGHRNGKHGHSNRALPAPTPTRAGASQWRANKKKAMPSASSSTASSDSTTADVLLFSTTTGRGGTAAASMSTTVMRCCAKNFRICSRSLL